MKQPIIPANQRGEKAATVMKAQVHGSKDSASDTVTVGRRSYTFTGEKQINVSLDPSEFKGLKVPQISEAIMKQLKEIDGSVSYFDTDVELTAIDIDNALHGQIPGSDIE